MVDSARAEAAAGAGGAGALSSAALAGAGTPGGVPQGDEAHRRLEAELNMARAKVVHVEHALRNRCDEWCTDVYKTKGS